MAREVSIGAQGFEDLRKNNCFYVDKTEFLRDWWESYDQVTLICRPRRFGKTLMLDTARCFLSMEFAGRGEELFGGLDVWNSPAMRHLQGSVPVVSFSFARCKGSTANELLGSMKQVIRTAVRSHDCLIRSKKINQDDRNLLNRVSDDMDTVTATTCLGQLCSMLHRHWGVRPVVLLDEYDTPLQEAWLAGQWEIMSSFVRQLFNATLKTNPDLGRALVTGVTRVASESIFSDMNNPAVITTLTPQYQTAFGFTEAEVDAALVEYGMEASLEDVRSWFDGFTFGDVESVYNPWSITSFLQWHRFESYWVNSSSNALVSELVQRGDQVLKADFEQLLDGGTVVKVVDERVHFRRLRTDSDAIWGLLLSAGYLRVARCLSGTAPWKLELALTNREVASAFDAMVREWFAPGRSSYSGFVRGLLAGDAYAMEDYLTDLAESVMSSFDSGTHPSRQLPERFWHGLVLGLVVDLRGRYEVRSNLESGYGRSDVILCPLDGPSGLEPAFVLEFKVFDRRHGERTLSNTVASALAQIEEKRYDAALSERGIAAGRIRHYGIAFQGKRVQVG